MNDDAEIDSLTVDALKEVSNIAAAHLSEVIGQILNEETTISVPEAAIINLRGASDRVAVMGRAMLSGYMKVLGDVSGSLIVLIPKKDAMKLIELTQNEEVEPFLFPRPIDKKNLSELIVLASITYLNSITHFLGGHLIPKSPILSMDDNFKLASFLNVKTELKEEYEEKNIVLVSIDYYVKDTDLEGKILMLVGPNILDYLENLIHKPRAEMGG